MNKMPTATELAIKYAKREQLRIILDKAMNIQADCEYEALCKQYNKTYRNPPKGMYRNSPISVQDLARKCTSKPIMI